MRDEAGSHEAQAAEQPPREKDVGPPPWWKQLLAQVLGAATKEPERTLLAGHEFDLSLLNALTYALFDTFFENSYIAVFATYVLELLVRFARRELARGDAPAGSAAALVLHVDDLLRRGIWSLETHPGLPAAKRAR